MTIKKVMLSGIGILVLGVILWLLPQKNPSNSIQQSSKNSEKSSSSIFQTKLESSHVDNKRQPKPIPRSVNIFSIDYENPENWWKFPISFYGKVVDESNQPLPEAEVVFIVNDESSEGTTEYHKKSDGNGLFALTGVKGKGTAVDVSKEGYYQTRSASSYFLYAGIEDTFFTPDPNNPVVFQLRKKGEAAELVEMEKKVHIPKDGTPVEISLLTGKPVSAGQGDIKIECWTMDQNQISYEKRFYDWKFRLSVPGGGLIESTQEFDFKAPTDGYRPFDEIDMPTSLGKEKWTDQIKKRYFLKLRNGNYARIYLEMIAHGGHFCWIESYLNPDGSRNLEYDKSKEIEVKVK